MITLRNVARGSGVVFVTAVALAAAVVPAAARVPLGSRLGQGTTPTTAAVGSNGSLLGRAGGGAVATCSPTTLTQLKGIAGRQLTYRQRRLQILQRVVGNARLLTAADRAALSGKLADELTGIEGLIAKVPADATCADVLADGRTMVTAYRVYVVMTPQVHLTVAADNETGVADQLASLEPRLSAGIDTAEQNGKDVTAARAALSDLTTQVASAQQSANGVAASVLALTPASYPAAWPQLQADQQRLQAGAAALRHAEADLRTIMALRNRTQTQTPKPAASTATT